VRPALNHARPDLRNRPGKIFETVGALSLGPDLALLHEGIHRRDGVVEKGTAGTEVAVVKVVNIHYIPVEVFQALLALVADMERVIGMFGRTLEMSHFGRDDEIGRIQPQLFEHSCQHPLGVAVAIDIGVVEMVDPGVDGGTDGGFDFLLLHIGPAVGLPIHPVQAAHRPAAK